MKKRHELLGQVLLIYGVAFLTPLGSVALSYLRGEDVSNFHILQIVLLAAVGLSVHVGAYIFLRLKSKVRKQVAA